MRLCSVLLAAALLPGCFAEIDLTGRRCPCDEGWTCVADRCVQGAEEDGGGLLVDAGTDAGVVRCPPGAFCEDFEGSNPAANGWTAFPDLAAVRYVDARDPDPSVTPHGGAGMLRVTTTTPGAQADVTVCPRAGFTCPTEVPAMPMGIDSGDIYLRAYLYAPSLLSSGLPFEMGHASVLYVGAHRGAFAAGEDVIGFNLDVDRVSMYVGTIGERIEPRPVAPDPDTRPTFPRDTWVCVRVHIHVDPVAGSVATYIGGDDVPEVSRADIDTVPTLPFIHVGVGLGYTDEMPNGAAIYADDVAFGTAPILCLD